VVSVLVRQHVGLRERAALGAELGAELLEEAEVDEDLGVAGAGPTAELALPQRVLTALVKEIVVAGVKREPRAVKYCCQ
jgi:hypothetical protein